MAWPGPLGLSGGGDSVRRIGQGQGTARAKGQCCYTAAAWNAWNGGGMCIAGYQQIAFSSELEKGDSRANAGTNIRLWDKWGSGRRYKKNTGANAAVVFC